jgi:hypothetical protein
MSVERQQLRSCCELLLLTQQQAIRSNQSYLEGSALELLFLLQWLCIRTKRHLQGMVHRVEQITIAGWPLSHSCLTR